MHNPIRYRGRQQSLFYWPRPAMTAICILQLRCRRSSKNPGRKSCRIPPHLAMKGIKRAQSEAASCRHLFRTKRHVRDLRKSMKMSPKKPRLELLDSKEPARPNPPEC
eukprot:1323819-Amorphochlora_amoeboformis.AAC.1